MNCTCTRYAALELDRASINKRMKATKSLIRSFVLLAESSPEMLKLLQCPHCGQNWQTGREWNFGNGEYAFHVPTIGSAEWLEEPFTQPASWLIYKAMMGDYLAKNAF